MKFKLPLRVALMDDNFFALESKAHLLRRDLRTAVCIQAQAPEELQVSLAELRVPPHVVLLDTEYRQPALSLGELIARTREHAPQAVVVCMSQYGDPAVVRAAAQAEVRGILLEGDIQVAIVAAMVRACRRRFVFTAGVEAALRGEFEGFLREGERLPRWSPNPRLSSTQLAILWEYAIHGTRTLVLADETLFSETTVETHRKLGLDILKDGWADESDLDGIKWLEVTVVRRDSGKVTKIREPKPEDLAFHLFTALPVESEVQAVERRRKERARRKRT